MKSIETISEQPGFGGVQGSNANSLSIEPRRPHLRSAPSLRGNSQRHLAGGAAQSR